MRLEAHGVLPEVAAMLAPNGYVPDAEKARQSIEFVRSQGIEVSPEAEQVILTWWGLRSTVTGPGRDCARTDFVIDPAAALDVRDAEVFQAGATQLSESIVPLGEVQDGTAALALRSNKEVIMVYETEMRRVGVSVDDAINRLVLGLSRLGEWEPFY